MEYNPRSIEEKWKHYWDKNQTYKVTNDSDKPKYYVLDMFPYPSGAGLHVGHPLGYIASDIFSRYKRLNGFNVLHPMGYDAFGLPAEQYAISTGVHPADSTAENVKRYRGQMDNLGFSYDWSREVQTSDPKYYRWTQWIFLNLFSHYYNTEANKAAPIEELISLFEKEGNATAKATSAQETIFTAEEWAAMSPKAKDNVLMNYRLAYRKVGHVNWCEALGTVLANDEIKDGLSERGGYPVVKKEMMQWSLRITAYAERLLTGLDKLDWSDALKAMQKNWIGRSEGAAIFFDVENFDEKIEVFTTRPDTIFGATFMVLAPEHDYVAQITTAEQQREVDKYLEYVNARSERERVAEVKTVTGAFTGAYAINPFNGARVPIYIAEYVLKDYGTGAIMAVPSDDERDQKFAEHFGLPIIEVVDKTDYPNATLNDKIGKIINSDFLNGMEVKDAIQEMFNKAEEMGIGERKINYRLRDANFSRQRYWGEPYPIKYDADGVAHADWSLPVELPNLDNFKPTAQGESPLSRVKSWVEVEGMTRETNTMPGYAGSSWYFLRYMDANNDEEFASRKALDYWQDVDLYIGGTEHAVGHLMYSRFWHKFLYDTGFVPTNEPFKKLINQGMIQGRSNFVYRGNEAFAEHVFKKKLEEYGVKFQANYPVAGDYVDFALPEHKLALEIKSGADLKRYIDELEPRFNEEGWKVLGIPMRQLGKYYHNFDFIIKKINRAIEGQVDNSHLEDGEEYPVYFSEDYVKKHDLSQFTTALHVDVNIVDNDNLDMEAFIKWRPDNKNAVFVTNEDGKYRCGSAVEKMSKSKYNVVNPDLMVEKYGSDCFRMYEMFLGPIEQSKPWDTKGIEGVSKFLRRFWGLYVDDNGFNVSDETPTKAEYKILHTAIKKVTEDIKRFSFNTCISAFMVASTELKKAKCNKKAILEPLAVLIAPFAPHVAEELWEKLGHEGSVHINGTFPVFEAKHLVEDTLEYPICVNGKKRAVAEFSTDTPKAEMEKTAVELPDIQKWIEGKKVVKIIVVPKRMVNIVVKG
jgi:leucyl-tRNA synthetase